MAGVSAADLLHEALEAAPAGLRVDVNGYGHLDLFDADDKAVMEVWQRGQDALRLLGLLLAAAPALAAAALPADLSAKIDKVATDAVAKYGVPSASIAATCTSLPRPIVKTKPCPSSPASVTRRR